MNPAQFQKMENELRSKHAEELKKLELARKEMEAVEALQEKLEVARLAQSFEDAWVSPNAIRDVAAYLRKQVFEVKEASERSDSGNHNIYELRHIDSQELIILFAVVAKSFADKASESLPACG